MKPTVVMLFSDKRSGSTIFQEELCNHPAVKHVAYSPHTYFETHHWLKAACILKQPKHLFYGHKVYNGYGSRMGARQYLIDCIRGNVPDFAVPDDDETLVFEGWEALCRQFARPVFFEKSPQYPQQWAALDFILKWLARTAFDVRFIGLIRNPMAVMYSARELFFTDPFERQFAWAHCYRNLLAMQTMVGNERFHFVRYEELIARPQKIFKEICDYIGIEYSDAVGANVHDHSMQKWRNDPAFTLQLHESVMRMADYFGYREADVYNPLKPGESLRAKMTRYVRGTLKLATARFYYRVVHPLLLKTIRRK